MKYNDGLGQRSGQGRDKWSKDSGNILEVRAEDKVFWETKLL